MFFLFLLGAKGVPFKGHRVKHFSIDCTHKTLLFNGIIGISSYKSQKRQRNETLILTERPLSKGISFEGFLFSMKKEAVIYKQLLLESGGDLLSRAVSSQVPSALKVLTSVFGMGTGGTPSPLPPETVTFLWGRGRWSFTHHTCPRYRFSSGSLPLPWSFRSCLPGCSPFQLIPFGTIKSNACCAFTLRYSRPLSHLDNCTVKKNLYHLVGPFFVSDSEIKPSTY